MLYYSLEANKDELDPITDEHPEIREAMKKVEQQVKLIEPSVEMFAEALSEGIKTAEERRREETSDERR